MLFTQPEFKKTYYLLRAQKKLSHDILDVYINNIRRIESSKNDIAYVITIVIKDVEIFDEFDNDVKRNLSQNSSLWFKTELSEDDLNTLYKTTVCKQTKTMQVILMDTSKVFVNNKLLDLSEAVKLLHDISFLRRCTMNLQIHHNGLYIYSKMTSNKWVINTLNIYQEDDMEPDEKEDIEESWIALIDECNEILSNKILTIRKTQETMNSLYKNILTEKNKKKWEDKIGELKKIIQNIIF